MNPIASAAHVRDAVEIRAAEPDDAALVFDAYARRFEGDVDAVAPAAPTAETWRWGQENPDGPRAILALANGEVVGLVSGCAQGVLLEGEPATLQRIDDVRISSDRRRGLGNPGLVVRMLRAHGDTFGGVDRDVMSWGFPTPAAWRVANWHAKFDAARTQFKLCRDVGGDSPPSSRGASDLNVEEVPRFDDDVDAFSARCAEGKRLIAIRDARRLNWRFVDRPDRRYERAVVRRAGELAGVAVFRAGEFDGAERTGLLCDWIVPPGDVEAADALLAWLVERARQAGCERLDALLPETSPDWRLFQDHAGFRAVRLERRFLLAFRAFTKRLRPHWLYNNWHYTFADTDFS